MEESFNDLIFGVHPLIEALESGQNIDKILLNKESRGDSFTKIKQLAKSRFIPVSMVPLQKLQRVTRSNHQGVVAFISPIAFQSIETVLPALFDKGKDPLLLILDGITDVRNFGSILRTSECMGVDAVMLPAKNSVAVNADTVKTSAGAIYNIPICKEWHFGTSMQYLKNAGVRLIGCTEKTDKLASAGDYTGPIAIVMGAEDIGIHPLTIDKLDEIVKIPMAGKTASLNVAVATGMILYEVQRQKNK
ncbi:MAG: 23S rRNA (guanosine(2251)-2'-O)-methyltransferase RlmB [Flavobacteriales bacterium]|nr:23S rRNA (guanosine(2251)-2'-O)-methyltransferase RlmB [Flavobacteriales bacterium]